MTFIRSIVFICSVFACTCAWAREFAPSPIQRNLIGHWVSEKDSKLHTYFSPNRRLVERDIPNSDARFEMTDYQVWDEWPELRTVVVSISISEGTQVPMLVVITLSEDGRSAVCREKSLAVWSKSFRILRVDDRTYPAKMPEKLKILDVDSGVGGQ